MPHRSACMRCSGPAGGRSPRSANGSAKACCACPPPHRGRMCQRPDKPGSVGRFPAGRPFIWDAHRCAPQATNPRARAGSGLRDLSRAARLFGLAPGGVYHAAAVASRAVRSCRTLSPLPEADGPSGGLLSVALSLGSPPAGVTRHRRSVEPGLSSAACTGRHMPQRPPGPLALNKALPRGRAAVNPPLGEGRPFGHWLRHG